MTQPRDEIVIHLLDWAACGPPAAWAIAALRQHDHARTHRVILLGSQRDAHAAQHWLGSPADAVHTPSSLFMLPTHLLRHDDAKHAAVVAWSWRSFKAARLRAGQRKLGFLLQPIPRQRWRATAPPAASIGFASASARDASRSGFASSPVLPLPVPELPNQHELQRSKRAWSGLDDAAQRYAIAGVGWPGRAVSGTRVSYLAGVLAIGGHPSVAIVPSDADDLERARRFAHRHNDAWPVFTVAADAAEPILAADIALWCGHPAAMLELAGRLHAGMRVMHAPLLAEMLLLPLALGVPVIAESVSGTREVFSGEASRWLTAVGDRLAMNRLAFAILTNAAGAADEHRAHARSIVESRAPEGFAIAFSQWLAGERGCVTPVLGATSS